MSIRDEARQAAQEYAQRHVGGMQPVETIGDRVRAAFEAGAVWRDEQADREPSEEEVEAAGRGLYENRVSLIEGEVERRSWPTWAGLEKADADEWRDAGRAALIAALEVRRG